MLCLTSCMKDNSTIEAILPTELSIKNVETNIVGTWRLIEKGIDLKQYENHVCTAPESMMKNQYMIVWSKTTNDEKRNFKENGDYNSYLKTTLSCQGTYKITNGDALEMITTCLNFSEKIVGLTSDLFIIKEGEHFYKYGKSN